MKGHQRIAAGLSQRDLYDHDRTEYHRDEDGRILSVAEYEEMSQDDRPLPHTRHQFRQPIPLQDYYSQQVQQNTRHYDRSSRLRSMGSASGLREKRNDETNLQYEQRVNQHY